MVHIHLKVGKITSREMGGGGESCEIDIYECNNSERGVQKYRYMFQLPPVLRTVRSFVGQSQSVNTYYY
jgi:hypothetical protein